MTTAFRKPSSPPEDDLPPLRPGERMDRAAFHARYARMPPHVKAELIGGTVYMPSPVGRKHGRHHLKVCAWLDAYEVGTPGVEVADNATVFLADDGEPQPDACLLISPDLGQTRVEGDYIAGAPELVVEVAASSADYDLHAKKADYERAGVREYVVLLVQEPRVLWLVNRNGRFEELAPGEDGLYRSEVFPGLWLDAAALLRLDSRAVRESLERGLASEEHGQFVERLSRSDSSA